MATMNTMINQISQCNTQVDKMFVRIDAVAEKMMQSCPAVIVYNEKMEKTESNTKKASAALGKIKEMVGKAVDAKKIMNMADSFLNVSTGLALINDGLQTQAQLQDKVFAAANRSRNTYAEMAGTVVKLQQTAGDVFGSNEEVVAFAELMQKTTRLSGLGQGGNASALSGVTQALGDGEIQGGEMEFLTNSLPKAAEAVANYMGVSGSELQELAAEGAITAEVFKNAMFASADEINSKFKEMPMTFGDVWTRIKSGGEQAFGDVFTKMGEILSSDGVQSAIGFIISGVNLAGQAVEKFINFFTENWSIIGPLLLGAAAVWLTIQAVAIFGTLQHAAAIGIKAAADFVEYAAIIALIIAQGGLNAAMAACPITWIIGAVILLIAIFYAAVAAINKFAGTSYSATGIIMGAFAVAGAVIGNIVIGLVNTLIGIGIEVHNLFATLGNFLANVFNDPVGAIIGLFMGLFDVILGIVQSAAGLIDTLLGTNMASAVEGFRSKVSSATEDLIGEQTVVIEKKNAEDYKLDRIAYADAWDAGYNTGEGMENSVSDMFSGFGEGDLFDDAYGNLFDNDSNFATQQAPAVVEGTGKDGSMQVDMADEDIQYLRDLAQRDYIAKIASNTLAPNIRVEFSGPVSETVTREQLGRSISEMLRDEIAAAPEGGY